MGIIISQLQKTPVMEEDDTINAGGASNSTNQPAVLRVAKEQQSDAHQEPKSKDPLFHLIGDVNGVSVHYLRTILLQEVRDAGLDEDTATIYEMEDLREPKYGIIRSKGAQHTCTRDGRLGATYVDSIQGEDFVGAANVMLSYCWSYKIKDIVKTLEDKCEADERDPKRTYIWICCLCNNQHRVGEDVPFEQFRDIFGTIVTRVGTMWSMMTPWDDPYYLTRVWCIFEIFTANTTPNCKAEIVMPAEQKKAMIESLSDIDNLLKALAKTKIENAKASREEDKTNILALVEESVGGHAELNIIVNKSVRKSIIGILKEEEQFRARRSGDTSTDMVYAPLCNDIGIVLIILDDFNDALEMFNKALAIREKVLGKEHPGTAESYNNIGIVMRAMGDNVGAVEMFNKALTIKEKVYGKEHPSTATSYNNIGNMMVAMGDNVGALKMYNKALAIREKVLGKQHPDTIRSFNAVAAVAAIMKTMADLE